MKSLICSLALILSVLVSKAQFPITSTQGSVTTLTKPLGGLQAGVGLIMTVYTDTTTANLNAYLKTYNGALIYSLSDSALYFRSNGASKWVQILPSGGTTGLNAWLVGGNTPLLTDANGNATFGANQNSGIIFRTNSLTRLILDKGGIVRSSGAANKYLTYDTITKQLYYGDAASVANEWHITGNSGTTAGTNFLGTTDNKGLMFKVNGGQAGYIETTSGNVSLGAGSFVSNSAGTGISAFGDNSLHFNTTGVNNTAIGQSSLYHTINATYNTAVGLSSMQENTSGGSNTAVGAESLYGDTSGTNNTAIGRKSLYQVTSGTANIGLGYFSGANSGNLSQRLFINSLNRTNISGDTTKSIIYGYQDATASNQRLYSNAIFYTPYSTNNSSQNRLVGLVSGTGENGYINIGTGLSLSGGTLSNTVSASSPAGNYGNLQINRNGVFATPASDSLNFSGGILSTKGTLIQSGNGALSASAITGTGTWITGGSATTTKPYVLIEPTGTTSTAWNTAGTGLGINAASGFIGYLFEAQIAGVSKFTISNAGAAHTGNFSAVYYRNNNNNFHLYGANTGTGTIGALTLYDGSESGAAFLQMGGTSSSYPGISRNGTGIDIKLANNSAYTGIQSLYDRFGSGSPESVVTAPVGAVYHRTDGGAGTSYYVKESGSGNTGWVAK